MLPTTLLPSETRTKVALTLTLSRKRERGYCAQLLGCADVRPSAIEPFAAELSLAHRALIQRQQLEVCRAFAGDHLGPIDRDVRKRQPLAHAFLVEPRTVEKEISSWMKRRIRHHDQMRKPSRLRGQLRVVVVADDVGRDADERRIAEQRQRMLDA